MGWRGPDRGLKQGRARRHATLMDRWKKRADKQERANPRPSDGQKIKRRVIEREREAYTESDEGGKGLYER